MIKYLLQTVQFKSGLWSLNEEISDLKMTTRSGGPSFVKEEEFLNVGFSENQFYTVHELSHRLNIPKMYNAWSFEEYWVYKRML